MTEQQRRVHNAYNRAYYAQHRDRILQNKRDNREARNAYMREYRAANYEKLSAYYSDRRRKKSRDTAFGAVCRCSTFGAFLRENGITQTAAAKMLGVSVSTANCWANGITTANEDKIRAVWPEYGGAECRN